MTTKVTPTTDAELAELKRMYEAATKGEWAVDQDRPYIITDNGHNPSDIVYIEGEGAEALANAQLVAAAHNSLPNLIARLEATERKVERVRELIGGQLKYPFWPDCVKPQTITLCARDARELRELIGGGE